MSNSNDHGGVRKGAGRKPKVDEQQLIERLSPLTDIAYKALEDGLTDGQSWAAKMFFEYMYGKPKQIIEQKNVHEFTEGFDITKLYGKDSKAQ